MRNITPRLHQTVDVLGFRRSYLGPFESLPGGGRISRYGVILNVKDGTADCVPAGNVRHGLSNAKKLLLKITLSFPTDCSESSDGKLNPRGEPARLPLPPDFGSAVNKCDGRTEAIWGGSIFYSCGVSLSAPADSVFLSQMTLHDGCKMRQRV